MLLGMWRIAKRGCVLLAKWKEAWGRVHGRERVFRNRRGFCHGIAGTEDRSVLRESEERVMIVGDWFWACSSCNKRVNVRKILYRVRKNCG